MSREFIKNLPINLLAILICLAVVFGFTILIKANPGAKIQFTADVIVSLSGISDGDLYIAQNSECDSLSVSGSTLTISDIPAGSDFILKTSSYNNALKITPSGGVLDLTFASSNLSSGNITQWTLNADSGTTVAHIVGAPQANTWYAIKTDSVLFNSFQSNASGEVSFTYNGGFSSKVFAIEQDTTAPTEFSLVSPINNAIVSNSNSTFSWNASTDPDLSYYQLYIDSNLDTDNITNTSTTPTNSLSCGSHTWYVKAIDNAGNSTSSSTFNLTIACASGLPPSASNPPTLPESTSENPEGGFSVTILRQAQDDNNNTIVVLKLNAGSDTTRMAISNTEDFEYASQVLYEEEIEWDLLDGRDEAVPRSYDGEYTVYAKFYTQYGVASEVVSDSIILKTADTETEEQTENSNQEESTSETKNDESFESPEDTESNKIESIKSASFIFTEMLQFNSNNNEVTHLQNKLKELNFFPKEIKSNGNFGPITKQAVMEYQKSKEIYPCGIVGPRTRKALNNEEFITNKDYQFTQDLKYNDKNEEVKELQARLKDQNFFPYNIESTGRFGSITQKAVNIFQKFYNLIQSGIVDEGMRGILNR